MQVGRIANMPVAVSMRIGNTALQQKKNDNALADVIPQKLQTDAQNSTKDSAIDNKKISKDMKAKLKSIKEDIRLGLTPEQMRDAKRLIRLVRGITSNHMDTSKRFAERLEPIYDEKNMIDGILNGDAKAGFDDMTVEEALAATEGKSFDDLVNKNLSKQEQAAAYKLYGNDYLQARSDVLKEKIDGLREEIGEHNEFVKNKLDLIMEEWNSKFGGNPKLQRLMKSMLLGNDEFADIDAEDLFTSVNNAISAAERKLKNIDRLANDFAETYSADGEEKVYA